MVAAVYVNFLFSINAQDTEIEVCANVIFTLLPMDCASASVYLHSLPHNLARNAEIKVQIIIALEQNLASHQAATKASIERQMYHRMWCVKKSRESVYFYRFDSVVPDLHILVTLIVRTIVREFKFARFPHRPLRIDAADVFYFS